MPATSIYVLRICGRGAGQETSSSLFGRWHIYRQNLAGVSWLWSVLLLHFFEQGVPALEVDHNSVYPHPGTTPWTVAQWARPVVTTSYSCWVFTRCLSNSAANGKRDFSWVTNNQVTTRNHMSQGTPLRHCKIANVKRKTGQHLLCMRFIFLWRPPGWTVPAVWPKQTQTQQNETTRCKSQVTLGETQRVFT